MTTALHQYERTADPDIKHAYSVPPPVPSIHLDRREGAEHISSPALPNATAAYDSISEAQIKTRLTSAASKNSELLVTLRDTADVPGLLTVKRVHIEKLQTELDTQEARIIEIEEKLEALKRERHKRRPALWWHIKHLLVIFRVKKNVDNGSGIDQAENDESRNTDEKLYFEAIVQKSKAEHRRTELKLQITASQLEEKDLLPRADAHGKAHQELDALYESIFAGPTPGFPSEDAVEGAFQAAIALHSDAREQVLSLRRGLRHLEHAKRGWKQAEIYLRDAKIGTESVGTFGFGSTTVRSDLINFDHYCTVTSAALDRAASQEATINDRARDMRRILGSSRIEHRGKLEKVGLLEVLSTAEKGVVDGTKILEDMMEAAKQEEISGRLRVRDTAKELEDRRSGLQQARQEAFEEVVGFGAAPPAYHNCCSRQGAYEAECDVVIQD